MILARSVESAFAFALVFAPLGSAITVNGQGFFGGRTTGRSVTLKVTAVDLAGRPVEGFQVTTGAMKIRKPAGMMFSTGSWQTMLFKPQPNGATLFSRVLPLRISSGKNIRMRNIRMEPGVTVRGRLSDHVPRPIKRGVVITVSGPLPKDLGDRTVVTWHDWTRIDDGASSANAVIRNRPRSVRRHSSQQNTTFNNKDSK